MAKKPDLSEALRNAGGRPVAAMPSIRTPSSAGRVDRNGKKTIAGFFAPSVSKQLKQLALDRDSTVQALLEEALADLFRKYTG